MALRNFNRVVFPASSIFYSSSNRTYARWLNRNPARVTLPFEPQSKVDLKKEKVIELTDLKFQTQNNNNDVKKNTLKVSAKPKLMDVEVKESCHSSYSIEKSDEIKRKKDEKLKRRKLYISQLKVFDDNKDIIYEKVMDNDAKVSTLILKAKSKKEGAKSGLTLVEGWRMIVDGLEAKCNLKYLMFSRIEDLNNLRPFLPTTGVKIYKMPYKEVELWSDMETPPGVFGIFERVKPQNIKRLGQPLPLQFICDNVRVPGNLGAILRVAVGAGCEKVLLTKGCVDLWDPKVIRSAAGAHFRLPIYNSITWEDMPSFLEKDTSVLIADSNTSIKDVNLEKHEAVDQNQTPVLPYYAVDYPTYKHITLIIGGETEGISEQSYEFALSKNGIRVNIPLNKGVDSLNTGMATAVIAFEIKKQLIQAWTKAKYAAMQS